ncbi:ubiquitin carboxyl-terminal hydrolase 40 [Plakobranchus ocellatus]|uniref:Ubiquitin carboxyl-terminal hydrolase 40 n=1 Tax=Plakobranchus ocellatus TaxID=259542 RepID=A0AAV4CCW8_9GAST|nr:ubiquitin carboxyl-terminal hydrolase 40 [Plakobranchus ocellatus]
MFGDLFNEESVTGEGGLPVSTLPPPPPGPRSECGLAGIDNQGATCYLNSLLQTLLLTPEFREKLFALTEADLGTLDNKGNPQAKVRVIPLELQRLFAQLLLSNQQSVSTSDLTNSFGWTNQEAFQQHDVQELNRILFNAIEESLVGTPGQNIITELYHGTIVNQIICLKCKKISEREEDFQDLTLAVAGMSGLDAVLKQCYCFVENMTGNNQYRCEACKTYTDATKGAKLRNLPPILSISLLRFSYDFVKMSRYKENGRFTFPMEIDMSPFSEKQESGAEDQTYELFSVVVHRGSAFGGHYFAYIRDIDSLGSWVAPHDEKAQKKVDPSSTGLDIIECQSPVDLIENILGGVEHQTMSIDRLCAEISKTTGVSWNKRFKKVHGPLNKFLKNCSNFNYNADTAWVSLSSDPPENDESLTKHHQEEVNDVNKGTEGKSERALDDIVKPGQHWFCFNDSHVGPIHTRDIEKQFSGKESAYMLFYRRKTLIRPISAHATASYKIPDKLIKEVDILNSVLDKQRQEYDLAINKITVQVCCSKNFAYNCLLHLQPDTSEDVAFTSIEIDRRKTFGDLKAIVMERIAEMDMHNIVFHEMKPRGGGYHLYRLLENEEGVLKDMGVSSNTLIFAWDGIQVNGAEVCTGEENEPLQLSLKDVEAYFLATIVVNKNRTLTELYHAVSEAIGREPKGLQMASSENGHKVSTLLKTSDVSLAEIGLKDGDVLVVMSHEDSNTNKPSVISTNEEVSNKQQSKQQSDWSLTLLNRLAGGDAPHTCMTLQLCAQSSETLRDLKMRVFKLLGVENVSLETVRLREEHQTLGLQPPLREALSLADAGLSNGCCLVLEHGRPPQDSEMTVGVNKVVSGKLVLRREFVVDRQLTVLGMLQAACKLMDCEGIQWYLSKTDVYGDPAEPLDDSSATLVDLLINDGDTLILQQGALIKKDQVYLNVWLVSNSSHDNMANNNDMAAAGDAQRQDEADRVMLDLASKLSMADQVPSKDLNPLNEGLFPKLEQLFENSWVVQKAMGVEDLKQALMSTDRFQSLMIPTSGFMRLRLLESGKLKAVLRSNSQVLRHATSKETVHLAVEILKHEESLGMHEILLQVAQKIGGTRIYLPPREFVWHTSGGVGAADLKRSVCQRFNLPLHDVLLAKYCPDTCTWTVLRDQPQKINRNRGKKKGSGHKSNIRHAPYYVQDGDLIGLKILSEDKGFLDPGDFSTQEDIDKRQILLQIAEEKKRLREERKKLQAGDGFPSMRRPEATLTIKVDKFS